MEIHGRHPVKEESGFHYMSNEEVLPRKREIPAIPMSKNTFFEKTIVDPYLIVMICTCGSTCGSSHQMVPNGEVSPGFPVGNNFRNLVCPLCGKSTKKAGTYVARAIRKVKRCFPLIWRHREISMHWDILRPFKSTGTDVLPNTPMDLNG